jgi:hypothetical protein
MPFLVIRSISNLALTLIYVYLAHYEQKSTGVITAVLLGLTSVAVYTGLVVIGLDNEGWELGADPSGCVNIIFDCAGKICCLIDANGKQNSAKYSGKVSISYMSAFQ